MSFSRDSLVVRLWLALSLVATLFTIVAMTIYFCIEVGDRVDELHRETSAKMSAVIASATLLRNGATTVDPNAMPIIRDLGIVHIDVLDDAGVPIGTMNAGAHPLQGTPIESAVLAQVAAGRPYSHTVRLDNDVAKQAQVKLPGILFGGSYGEERIVSRAEFSPGLTGYIRVIASYDGFSDQIIELMARSASTAALIVSAILICMWPFLQHFVGRPLRNYSATALQIASGRATRMPSQGTDELSELGRAINGMADVLRHQATVDPLTGLYNMRHFSSTMETLVGQAVANNSCLGLVVADLDQFKPVNDTYGHQSGDRVLQAVADAMLQWAGPQATCWRLGGDEFVAAIPVTDADEAQDRSAQLRRLISELRVSVDGEAVARPMISVGVAIYPGDADSVGALFGIADRRMYQSKALREELKQYATPAA